MQLADPHLLPHLIQARAIGRGDSETEAAYTQGRSDWLNQKTILFAQKATVTAQASGDLPVATVVSAAFLTAMRPVSITLRLSEFMERVPMRAAVFVNGSPASAALLADGAAIPAVKGNWGTVTLLPKHHAALVVMTRELVQSMAPLAAQGPTQELVEAVAQVEDFNFISPEVSGSALYGSPTFSASGSDLASVDADLKQLLGLVDASRPGTAWVMTQETATALSLLRGTGGAAPAFPNIGPQGGTLLNLPVYATPACSVEGSPLTRIVGLVNPGEILYADEERVSITASSVAAIQQDDAPTSNSVTGTASSHVSLFATSSVAVKAIRESSWYARAGAGAYFVAGY